MYPKDISLTRTLQSFLLSPQAQIVQFVFSPLSPCQTHSYRILKCVQWKGFGVVVAVRGFCYVTVTSLSKALSSNCSVTKVLFKKNPKKDVMSSSVFIFWKWTMCFIWIK